MARCDPTGAEWTVIAPVQPTAIRTARKLEALDVIDAFSFLFSLRGVPGHVPSNNGTDRSALPRPFRTGSQRWDQASPTSGRQPVGEPPMMSRCRLLEVPAAPLGPRSLSGGHDGRLGRSLDSDWQQTTQGLVAAHGGLHHGLMIAGQSTRRTKSSHLS